MRHESENVWRSKLSRMRKKAQAKAKALGMNEGFRSGFELQIAIFLKSIKHPYEFETDYIKWVPRQLKHKYTPDFKVKTKSGKTIYIETKGRFTSADREKHLAIKEQHPDIDIRFIFSNPRAWDRAAKTRSYAKWAEKYGFKYCGKAQAKKVISQWLKE